ncbi:MAG: hypothetical protein Q8N25_02520 [Methylotenera sp.]|nr:hypothetical protein [Methylotenera sp.]MDP2152373.1 hypothetical protein [Methylotenera sp.]MDP3059622.1 hypothetical protein [Methylotenera sp.]
MSSYDLLLKYKSTYMQRIAEYAQRGYESYCSGISPDLPGYLRMVAKFIKLYDINQTPMQRYRSKLKGQAGCILVAYCNTEKTKEIHWILLLTKGTHIAKQLEKLNPIDQCKYSDFQLHCTKSKWTWRLQASIYEGLRFQVVKSARIYNTDPMQLNQVVHLMYQQPKFSGIREQIKKLRELVKAEFKRRKIATIYKFPRLYYLQKQPNEGYLVSAPKNLIGGKIAKTIVTI